MIWPLRSDSSGAVILLYHRVADVIDDPLLLSVSSKNFRSQLIAMKDLLPAISLQQIAKDVRHGKNPRGFAVTFDDGYVDNLEQALPILEELKVPASVYVVSGKVNKNEPFDWDKKTSKNDRGRAVNNDEIKKLANSPMIEIGAHTVNHPHLGLLKAAEQRREILQSKKILEQLIGEPVTGFAYPFGAYDGDFTPTTEKICAEGGFSYACKNIAGIATKSSNLYALPRVLVRNWRPAEMLENLKEYIPK